MVEERVALEASRLAGKLADLQSQLEDKADKAGVAAALSQRLDEVYAFVERLRDALREVLAQKADVSDVNQVLERKADARLVSEALGRYTLSGTVEAQLTKFERRIEELAEQETFGRLSRQSAGPKGSKASQPRSPVEEGVPASTDARNLQQLQQAVSSLTEDTLARFSKLELSVIAASQLAEEKARQATDACLARFREALAAMDVNIRANSALISKAQACAEQARSEAARVSAAYSCGTRETKIAAALAPLSRDVAALSGRLMAAETSLRRKIDRAELQAVKRQLEATPAMKTVSEALTARPTLDQVRGLIRDLVRGDATASVDETGGSGEVGGLSIDRAPAPSYVAAKEASV